MALNLRTFHAEEIWEGVMRLRLLSIFVLMCLWPASSSALGFKLGVEGGSTMTLDENSAMLGCGPPGPGGSFQCSGTNMMTPDWNLTSWMLNLDPDPTVFANTVVRNMTGSTQTFFLNIVLPISVNVGPPSIITGSIQGGVTDTNGNASALLSSVAPTAIYRAAIDGVVVRTLLNHVSSLNVNAAFQSKSFIPSPGYSNEILAGTSATTNIAIFLRFDLSPGDSASFTSVFNVVPEPSTAALLGLGLLGLLATARRGKASR
jgi:hypothetical protein